MGHAESLNQPSCGDFCAEDRPSAAKVLVVDPWHPDEDVLAQAASYIIRGGVAVFPTETFYGLGGNPWLSATVEQVYRIKRRDPQNPLPLIAPDGNAVRQAVAKWPTVAELLARAFWPGPLSLVLAASPLFPPGLHAGTGTIAVRVSSHPVARKLAAAAGGLLISTSANLSGHPPCQHLGELAGDILAQVDQVVDAGPTPGGLPSTLVDASVHPPRLVREGAIGWERIKAVLA